MFPTYSVEMMQPRVMWVLHVSCDAETAISPSPVLSLCHCSITIVAAQVILLLAVLLLLAYVSAKSVCSGHASVAS
jgi:hypothetical protein